ncbi:calnexin-like [Acipenser oxyrinchus oxyrinchus]|uniref:Calnexin-like n=1 Tax=Acipenser oxyrinchus oxyrinchus TaxID=40147 RepID=A0AAD8DD04_ACIOX|nr:calnexin-like [Acipenser oxyrinchus oxyrinchus]
MCFPAAGRFRRRYFRFFLESEMMYVLSLLVLSCTSVYSQETFGVAYRPPQPAGGVHFSESFHSSTIEDSKWVTSKAKIKDDDDNEVKYDGLWVLEEPMEQKLPGDKGLVLKSRARLHAIAAPLDRVFHFHDQPLIPGVVLKLFAATEKRPWLWGVYVFTVALPVVLIISFCWPDKRFGPPDQDYFYKKTDDPQLDDSVDPEEGSKSSA